MKICEKMGRMMNGFAVVYIFAREEGFCKPSDGPINWIMACFKSESQAELWIKAKSLESKCCVLPLWSNKPAHFEYQDGCPEIVEYLLT